MSRSNHFSWTLFDFEDHLNTLRSLNLNPKVQYLLWGREVCPNTGRAHLQGYIQLTSRIRLATVKNIFGIHHLHLEPCHGSDEDNEVYCTKDDCNVERFGERLTIQRKGKNGSGYEELMASIKDGMDLQTVMTVYPALWFRHHSAIIRTFQILSRQAPSIFYGPFRFSIDPD